MKRTLIALLCLLVAAPAAAFAQGAAPAKKPPVSAQEAAAKNKAVQMRMADCSKNARGKNLSPNTPAFNRFMTDCLKG